MPQTPWSSSLIKQCNNRVGQGVLSDERSLAFYSEDFSHLQRVKPAAVFTPQTTTDVETILQFAQENDLTLTIRGLGLSQSGQALAKAGGSILSMENFTAVLEQSDDAIWVEANASWKDVLHAVLPSARVPYVVPYNCNLSIGGVLSAGGLGASSCVFGTMVAHVNALEVVTACGRKELVDAHSPLFHACLGGQGRFALITKAQIKLRKCQPKVKTTYLLYSDCAQWHHDMLVLRDKVDYMESFCTPAIQGTKAGKLGRVPFAAWFYAIQVGIEFTDSAPVLQEFGAIKPWQILHTQEEDIDAYLLRHESRFKMMQASGQWAQQHLWYECFVPESTLFKKLDELLAILPLFYANIVQVMPLAKTYRQGFFILPETEEEVFAFMILNPGLPEALMPGALEAVASLDRYFLKNGGKRYLSGHLGRDVPDSFWQYHFHKQYEDWRRLKDQFDPQGVFSSTLHP